MDMSYKIDEGYSEETRSQDELDSAMRLESSTDEMLPNPMRLAMDSIMSLREEDRSEFVYNVLQTLRTSSIARIVERLTPHLHKDPLTYLPPEVTSEIFSYLSPSMLLEASRVSRPWRERTLDSRLWKLKFFSEGWDLEVDELRALEQSPDSPRKARSRRAETYGEQRRQRRRMHGASEADTTTGQNALRDPLSLRHEAQHWSEQNGAVEADTEHDSPALGSSKDEEMLDVDRGIMTPLAREAQDFPLLDAEPWSTNGKNLVRGTVVPPESIQGLSRPVDARQTSETSIGNTQQTRFNIDPPLISYPVRGQPRLNYQQLYKQRRKLEENWNTCAYKSFQLPHRDHPEEAHRECVYTIQYIGRYLVSGSRDRTLRKWDLETQRLIGKPLQGHSASVLCLQFDNSKDEDVIISGSSDTDVIIWRYSTGELVERITQAHREPVLNLKFDHRFLVTCSKDKSIKIWNRHKISPGHKDYPSKGVRGGGKCPAYIVDLTTIGSNPFDIHKFLTADQRAPLREYTHLMTLDSHSAAVNAIHIYKDQLVSASGDRFVKVWNIHTGECTATCRGHQKGIACVQYDGKRIISGSSDNTIRIYDPATQGEVACLQGHSRLVRTIQSAFEDLPGSRDQLEKEAQDIDGQFWLAHDGRLPNDDGFRKRNPGSKQPKDITAVGLKLPPGGGGSSWGRIVSGSYDETIIIWRKGSDGRWVPGHRLRQEEALRAAGGPLASGSEPPPPQNADIPFTNRRQLSAQRTNASYQPQRTVDPEARQGMAFPQGRSQLPHEPQNGLQPLQQPMSHEPQQANQSRPRPNPATRLLTTQQPFSQSHNPHQSSSHAPVRSSISTTQANQDPRSQQQQQQQQHLLSDAGPSSRQSNLDQARQPPILDTQPIPPNSLQQPLIPQQQQQQSSASSQHPQPSSAHPQHPFPQQQHNAHPPPQTSTYQPHQPAATTQNHRPAAPPQPPPAADPAAMQSQPNARVFKLQFDARRIICCSQDPKIVGWDFANGDERIVEASRFFKAPQ
ncbi:MAG: hypothetical protein Q9191_003719 [Dirinaria sp. TL-2023a]